MTLFYAYVHVLKYLCKKYTKIIILSCFFHIIDIKYPCYTLNKGPNYCVSLSHFFRHSCKITFNGLFTEQNTKC